MSHSGTDGSNPGDRIARAGYRVLGVGGERRPRATPTPPSVMNGWMNSPGHRANILSGNVTQIGVGLAYAANGTPYWTMDLGPPGLTPRRARLDRPPTLTPPR